MSTGFVMRAPGLAFLLALVAQPVPAQAPGVPPLQAEAERIVQGASGEWGVVAWSIDRQRPLVAINAGRPMVPASNNKVFTAIWALDELGPDYRFPTDLLVRGEIVAGVLHGDVFLRGSGDPAFGYPPRVQHQLFIEHPMQPLER
ncbi:MAG TPA: D-alanyl-D-alanine carboxypeptidase, partial [Longimicrobiaceae bacterium]|nr:D-alanyl-D-alanine carboxypeptidase [Longimicrobiaceae bacterium]